MKFVPCFFLLLIGLNCSSQNHCLYTFTTDFDLSSICPPLEKAVFRTDNEKGDTVSYEFGIQSYDEIAYYANDTVGQFKLYNNWDFASVGDKIISLKIYYGSFSYNYRFEEYEFRKGLFRTKELIYKVYLTHHGIESEEMKLFINRHGDLYKMEICEGRFYYPDRPVNPCKN